MSNHLFVVSLVSLVGPLLVGAAPATALYLPKVNVGQTPPITGKRVRMCIVQRLPRCWSAHCRPEKNDVVVSTACTVTTAIQYNGDELKDLVERHCYPAKGELAGAWECCGGHPICAHEGDNRGQFNISHYLKIMFESLERKEYGYPCRYFYPFNYQPSK